VTLCKVVGPVIATVKHEAFRGLKLFVVQPVDEGGTAAGDSFLAVDRATGAGAGDTVLVLREGTGIRQLFGMGPSGKLPIRSCLVGIVDAVSAA
jgi:microcompartment protein CcmK/EutM